MKWCGSRGEWAILLASGIAFAIVNSASASISLYSIVSGDQAYFGSQGAGYEASDPVVGLWTAPPVGPYTPTSPLPNVPSPPTPVVYPNPVGNAFGAGHTSSFNDLYVGGATTATATVAAVANPSPSVVSDAYISVPSMNLTQSATAPGYAYEQLNLDADFGVIGGFLGGSTPALPLSVSGAVVPGTGNYAQLGAQLTYTWVPTNNSAYSPSGPSVTLGTLDYSFLQYGGGTFSTVVSNTNSLLPAPTNWGLLEITGDIWLAGDPSSITISSVSAVPEPSSLALVAIGIGLLGRRSRMSRR